MEMVTQEGVLTGMPATSSRRIIKGKLISKGGVLAHRVNSYHFLMSQKASRAGGEGVVL